MDTPISETAPKILENLVAAGLVSHELIGDPAKLGTESAALAALCARIAGPVYRLGAFHYAFQATATDLGGALGDIESAAWGAAIETSLAADLGEEAVWITGAADLVAGEGDIAFDGRQILFLKASDSATAAALAEAPDLQAVIHAGIAARTAETAAVLAAEAIDGAVRAAGAGAAAVTDALGVLAARVADLGALADRVADLPARIDALESEMGARVEAAVTVTVARTVAETVGEALSETIPQAVSAAVADAMADTLSGPVTEALAAEVAREVGGAVETAVGGALRQVATAVANASDPALERIVGAMEILVGRLTDQAARTAEQAARQDALASGMAALEKAMESLAAAEAAREAEKISAFSAFESRLGLTLAEFLAQSGKGSAPVVQEPVLPAAARVVEMAREPGRALPDAEFDVLTRRVAQLG